MLQIFLWGFTTLDIDTVNYYGMKVLIRSQNINMIQRTLNIKNIVNAWNVTEH